MLSSCQQIIQPWYDVVVMNGLGIEFKDIIKAYNLACWYKDMDNTEHWVAQLKRATELINAILAKLDSKFAK